MHGNFICGSRGIEVLANGSRRFGTVHQNGSRRFESRLLVVGVLKLDVMAERGTV